MHNSLPYAGSRVLSTYDRGEINKYIIHQFFVLSCGISSAGALRAHRIFRLISRVYLTNEDRVCHKGQHPERRKKEERERQLPELLPKMFSRSAPAVCSSICALAIDTHSQSS